MNWELYARLSALMFLEFAVWGAWMPVLAMRLLGPLKMTGKQTGWIYATFPLACIFAPLASGYMADKWFNAEWIILVSHAAGAVLLFAAARQTKFWGMFWVMLLYCVFFTATLPLVNKLLLQQYPEKATWVFLWAPVAWAVIGYLLTGLRQLRKATGDGPDGLYLAALLSVLMVVVSFFQVPLKPAAEGNPMLGALAMLKNTNYLIFILAQLVVAGMMQFYFLGTGQFMQDRGISGRNVSGAMGFAQAMQAVATISLLGLFLGKWLLIVGIENSTDIVSWHIGDIGYQWTFVIGALCWTVLYAVYVLSKRAWPIVLIQAFHGLAYVLFMIAGQMFVGDMAPKEVGASAQSLIFIATTGVGLFLGTQLAGFVMDKSSAGGKFQWAKIWTVPLLITLGGAVVFATYFKVPNPSVFRHDQPPAAEEETLAGP
jgi:MFS family permease